MNRSRQGAQSDYSDDREDPYSSLRSLCACLCALCVKPFHLNLVSRTQSLRHEPLRDRERPPKPKRPRRNLQPRRRLLALVFVAVDQQRDVANQRQVKSVFVGKLLRTPQILDISL